MSSNSPHPAASPAGHDPAGRKVSVLIVVGTRPEAIKLIPIILALRDSEHFRPVVVTTGQHDLMVREVFKLAGIWADVTLWVGDTRSRLNERVASVMLRFEDFFHQWFHEVTAGEATADDVREGRYPGRRARARRHELGVRCSARGVPPRHSRCARRGRAARGHGQHDAVPRGAQPPPDRAHRLPAPGADCDQSGEPRTRERADQAGVRDRQQRNRRARVGVRTRRSVRQSGSAGRCSTAASASCS